MQGNYRVLLVEDEKELCEEFQSCFAGIEGLELVGITDSASRALELVRELRPDAVILDLELHLGEGNGVLFLSQLAKLKNVKKPYVLVNTNNSSQTTYGIVRNLGADMVMYKHTQGHSPLVVAEVLLVAAEGGENPPVPVTLPAGDREEAEGLRQRIRDELNHVSISPKCVGYNYLADAIEICCGGYVPHISALVAEKYGKKVKSVEHAMQNAIDRAWKNTDIDEQDKYYKAYINTRRAAPTVMEFVRYYANRLSDGD